MEVLLSIMSQIIVTADSESDYEVLRDKLLEKLEKMGYNVNIVSEESDEESGQSWLTELEDIIEDEETDDEIDDDDEDEDGGINEDGNYYR